MKFLDLLIALAALSVGGILLRWFTGELTDPREEGAAK